MMELSGVFVAMENVSRLRLGEMISLSLIYVYNGRDIVIF